MSQSTDPALGINSWLEDELYHQYQFDRKSVDQGWTEFFQNSSSNGGVAAVQSPPDAAPAASDGVTREPQPAAPATSDVAPEAPQAAQPAAPAVPTPPPPVPETTPATTKAVVATSKAPAKQEATLVGPGEQLVPLRGAAARIAENMAASLSIPVATSQRQIPVRVVEENRNIINKQRALQGKGKLSFTHIIAWAIVRALKSHPSLNYAFAENEGQPFRVVRNNVNIGLAVDVLGKDGSRSLMVPNIKNADGMSFAQFVEAYDEIVARARTNKLQVADFQGTTISLTNPGTVGTFASVPRLMPGQGAIIATGAMEYPAEFAATSGETRAMLGISKVLIATCTYDHRIIQGAESGSFLGKLQQLLMGEENFYHQLFRDLKIPYLPIKWQSDQQINPQRHSALNADVAKEAAVIQLINAYRVRGHLIANTNPLGAEPGYHPELDPSSYGLSIWDLDRPFLAGAVKAPSGAIASYMQAYETLREILDRLRQTYCASMGVEYMHIQDPVQKQWLQDRMEATMNLWPLDESYENSHAEPPD